jgi:hypothetical protein
MAPCRSCEMNRRFGEKYRLHLQGRKIREQGTDCSRLLLPAHAGSSLADFSTLKMESIHSSEKSVHFTESTRRHIPEDGNLHSHRCENLKSYINITWFLLHEILNYKESRCGKTLNRPTTFSMHHLYHIQSTVCRNGYDLPVKSSAQTLGTEAWFFKCKLLVNTFTLD